MRRDIKQHLHMLDGSRAEAVAEHYKANGEVLDLQGPVPFDVFLYFIRASIRVRVTTSPVQLTTIDYYDD